MAEPPEGDPYQLLPEYSEADFEALKAEVAAHGVLVPVEFDEAGHLLDGHHRVRAWRELRAEGIRVAEFPRVIRQFASEDDRIAHVLSLNLARRHLSPEARRQVEVDLRARGWSIRRIAGALGVSAGTVQSDVSRVQNRAPAEERVVGADGKSYPAKRRGRPAVIANSPRDQRRAEEALRAIGADAPDRLLDVRRAEELGRLASLARRRSEPVASISEGSTWRIDHCDFRELEIEPASADAIVCDPPYGAEPELWSDLASWAARVLKPGRLLIAYAGKLELPDHMARLSGHLEYVWVGSTYLPGRHARVRSRMVFDRWRPWLVFSSGRYRARGWFDDAMTAEGRGEKTADAHPWQQAAGPFVKLVTAASQPGELVFDPFVGSGTTGLAALELGRRFHGCDVDAAGVSMALERMQEAEATLRAAAAGCA